MIDQAAENPIITFGVKQIVRYNKFDIAIKIISAAFVL